MINVYKVDGDRLKKLDSLNDMDPVNDCGWIDLNSPTLDEDHRLEDFLKISIPTQEDMKEIEPSARLYDEDGADYLTMLAVSLVNIGEPAKSPVTFILHGKILVTVRYQDFISFMDFPNRAMKKAGVPIASPQGLMLGIIETFIDHIADSLEGLGDSIDQISYDIFRSKKIKIERKNLLLQSSIRRIGAKGDLLGMLRESLVSVTRLLSHHSGRAEDGQAKVFRQKLSLLNRDVLALTDHAGFLSGKMNFLLDATLGMINLEQNQIIKIFSIAAVVFLPPTLVASVYGMNFHFMPELDWPFGYPVAIGAMIVSALIPLIYFKRKGWL